MGSLDMSKLRRYVEENIGEFHNRRLERLRGLNLRDILKRKNPYLFRAKNILTAQDLVQSILDAYLSSQEETLFGHFLEELAIYIAGEVFQGRKSTAEGIDLEMERDGTYYIVSIKSGPNWGNSSQIARMRNNFKQAQKRLRQSRHVKAVVAVNGCCYGVDDKPDKGDYLKLCGQRFWEFVSGDPNLYVDLIEPLGHKAKEKNDLFYQSYAQLLNQFSAEFIRDFCDNGVINWEKLLKFNSGADR
jgi:hypothetical protein